MEVIPNGIDTDTFRPDGTRGAGPRAEWSIRGGERVVGIAARLDPMKDHPTFLRAAGIAARKNANVRFVCVGDGPESYRRELLDLADRCGVADRVVWAGARDDMPAVYEAFDVATSTSVSEGFSNAIAEAMASGTPCAVTDVGDSRRIVGDVGRVVPPRDAEALAAAWLELLEGEGRPEPDRVRDRIVRTYSVDLLADRSEDLLRRLGAGAPR
jgi:glycosyltransferase involved in cell wall biosynthesis